MADASCTSTLASILPYVGPLFGVVVGAGLTWFLQRNEWGRQRRWELRRDATLDAVRAEADLEYALIDLNSTLSGSLQRPTGSTDAELNAGIKETSQNFRRSRASFIRAYKVADVAVGGQFSKVLSAYFLLTGAVSKDMTRQKRFLDNAKNRDLALSDKAVILSARQALGIKDAGELPPMEDQN